MVSVSVRYLFYEPMDEKIKTWTLQSPAKENLIWRFMAQALRVIYTTDPKHEY